MATVDKNFKIKNGLIVGDSTNLVNYTSASPFEPFVGQLWISASSLYAWSSASTWVLVGDGTGLSNVLIQTASNNQILSYNSASSLWMNKDLQAAIKEVDGTGSGIDADLLDGQHASYFMPTSASTIFDEVTYTANPPSSANIGDIWIESDVDVSIQTYHAAYSASAPVGPIIGDLWVDSNKDIAIIASNIDGGTPSSVYVGIINGTLDAGGAQAYE